MKTKLLTTTILGALVSVPVFAETPSFNMIEAGYTEVESDTTGYVLRGKMALTDNIFVTGAYSEESNEELEDFINGTAELTTSRVGVGGNYAIGENTAVYGQLEYLDLSSEISNRLFSEEDNDNGYIAAAGVRSMLTASTELYGELGHYKVEDAQTFASVGVRQYFTQNLGVFAEYTANDADTDGFAVGVSLKF